MATVDKIPDAKALLAELSDMHGLTNDASAVLGDILADPFGGAEWAQPLYSSLMLVRRSFQDILQAITHSSLASQHIKIQELNEDVLDCRRTALRVLVNIDRRRWDDLHVRHGQYEAAALAPKGRAGEIFRTLEEQLRAKSLAKDQLTALYTKRDELKTILDEFDTNVKRQLQDTSSVTKVYQGYMFSAVLLLAVVCTGIVYSRN
jgi:hypothetical protein